MFDLDGIKLELDNWKQYFKDRHTQRVTFSLEGRYKSEDIYDEKTPPKAPADARRAIEIEKIVTQLPFTHEICLVVQYMYPYALIDRGFYRTCRIAKVKPRDWDDTVRKAMLMVQNNMNKNHLQATQNYSIRELTI